MKFPFPWRQCAALCLVVAAATACSGIPNKTSSNILIPPETLNISSSVMIPAEGIAAGVIVYLIVDPLAPNWQIEQAQLDTNRYRVALKKKRFTTGGDGEAGQIFGRRATQIVRDNGASAYRVVEFTEGIESTVPLAQRVAQGVIEIVR
jgi:hypothetical protein